MNADSGILSQPVTATSFGTRTFTLTLTKETLNGMIRYAISGAVREHVVWHILQDVITMQHSKAAVLTSYGQSPGDLDYTMFLNGRAQGKS